MTDLIIDLNSCLSGIDVFVSQLLNFDFLLEKHRLNGHSILLLSKA